MSSFVDAVCGRSLLLGRVGPSARVRGSVRRRKHSQLHANVSSARHQRASRTNAHLARAHDQSEPLTFFSVLAILAYLYLLRVNIHSVFVCRWVSPCLSSDSSVVFLLHDPWTTVALSDNPWREIFTLLAASPLDPSGFIALRALTQTARRTTGPSSARPSCVNRRPSYPRSRAKTL